MPRLQGRRACATRDKEQRYASVMLECSRRGKRVTDRKCDFIQRYSKAEAEALEVAWDEWAALSKDTPSV